MANFCDLTGQVAIITGASSGIGAASARSLAKQGAKVVLAARRVEKLQQLASEIMQAGGEALPVQCDVGDKTQIANMVSTAVTKWGKVDILLNNAGVLIMKPTLEVSEEEWDKVIDTNLKGQFLVAQAVIPAMLKNNYGRIVNIASVASGGQGFGMPGTAAYTASKGGVEALTEVLASEFTKQGINVNAIAPGIIETEMTQDILTDQQMTQGILAQIPKGRVGKAEEIANVVTFLASKEAEYVSGAFWVVDGGWLAD